MSRIVTPQGWANEPGSEYHFIVGASGLLTPTNAHELADYGWTFAGTPALVAASSGDFGSSADDSPPYMDFATSGDKMLSPLIFGSYARMLVASKFLDDVVPVRMRADVYASWPVANVADTASGFGFTSGDAATTTNHTAFIASNGTNFRARNQGGGDVGAAIDTAWHKFSFNFAAGITWYIDDVSQGVLTLDTDLYPTGFGVSVGATNRVRIASVKIWYETT